MKGFLQDDFLLSNKISEQLYHDVAKKLPIIDYHNHLSPKDIFENRRFNNITEIWLDGDHYKWRAMRMNGIPEKYITGDVAPDIKFKKWAETVPYTLRNPLYHWTHMELKYPFGIDKLLNAETAQDIYDTCNEKLLSDKNFRVHGLLENWRVETLCTTDDPADSLEYHIKLSESNDLKTKVLPAFRPDNFLKINDPDFLLNYYEKIGKLTGIEISSFQSLRDAIDQRHAFFHNSGCRIFDMALTQMHVEPFSDKEIDGIIKKLISGKELDHLEAEKYRSALLYFLAALNHKRDWTQQFHIGALRNNNSVLLTDLGADTGCDSIDDKDQAAQLSLFFDRLKREDILAKTILYNLNPKDNAVFATMIGNFAENGSPGKLQYGAAWWFLDQKEGIISQLNTISNYGLLRRFVGMLTDSRSFLSYSRHEYFRRILCDVIGRDVENGELPADIGLLSQMVEEISYYNARNMLNL